MKICKIITAMQLLSLVPSPIYPINTESADESTTDMEQMEAITLKQRLEQIKRLNRPDMSDRQNKELQLEMDAIKLRLQKIGGGVYLSLGVVIILIFLVILLFV